MVELKKQGSTTPACPPKGNARAAPGTTSANTQNMSPTIADFCMSLFYTEPRSYQVPAVSFPELASRSYKLEAMKWLRAHPYLTALIGAALLIVTGAYIVANRSAVEPESGVRVWGGTGVNFFGSASDAGNNIPSNREGLYSEILSGPPFYYGSTNTQIPSQIESVNDFDFNEFLAMLSSSGGASTNTKPNG